MKILNSEREVLGSNPSEGNIFFHVLKIDNLSYCAFVTHHQVHSMFPAILGGISATVCLQLHKWK